MKGHVNTLYEYIDDPLVFILAALIALAILFFLCTTRVQAGIPAATTYAENAAVKTTIAQPSATNPDRMQSWYLDYTDVSNEATTPLETKSHKKLVGTVHVQEKQNALGKFFQAIKGLFAPGHNNTPDDSSPTFTSP